MTDVESQRRKAICEIAGVDDIGDLSDGFHTFNSLYEQRMILFAVLVKVYKDKAWKSYRHEDGEYCFGGGWFIVGIDTPEGSYTYHYENKYWDMFDCVDLPRGKHWDGHTEKDVTRLLALPSVQPDPCEELDFVQEHKKIPVVLNIQQKGKSIPSAQPDRKRGRWIPVSKELPDDLDEVNITWINNDPEPYYDFVKGKAFTGSAVFYQGDWYWYSSVTVDVLAEYGRCDTEKMEKGIKVTAWRPLPEPYKEEGGE